MNQNPSVSDLDASTEGQDVKQTDKAAATLYSNKMSELLIDETNQDKSSYLATGNMNSNTGQIQK